MSREGILKERGEDEDGYRINIATEAVNQSSNLRGGGGK
jgi:hypothetical protein